MPGLQWPSHCVKKRRLWHRLCHFFCFQVIVGIARCVSWTKPSWRWTNCNRNLGSCVWGGTSSTPSQVCVGMCSCSRALHRFLPQYQASATSACKRTQANKTLSFARTNENAIIHSSPSASTGFRIAVLATSVQRLPNRSILSRNKVLCFSEPFHSFPNFSEPFDSFPTLQAAWFKAVPKSEQARRQVVTAGQGGWSDRNMEGATLINTKPTVVATHGLENKGKPVAKICSWCRFTPNYAEIQKISKSLETSSQTATFTLRQCFSSFSNFPPTLFHPSEDISKILTDTENHLKINRFCKYPCKVWVKKAGRKCCTLKLASAVWFTSFESRIFLFIVDLLMS